MRYCQVYERLPTVNGRAARCEESGRSAPAARWKQLHSKFNEPYAVLCSVALCNECERHHITGRTAQFLHCANNTVQYSNINIGLFDNCWTVDAPCVDVPPLESHRQRDILMCVRFMRKTSVFAAAGGLSATALRQQLST